MKMPAVKFKTEPKKKEGTQTLQLSDFADLTCCGHVNLGNISGHFSVFSLLE